MEFKCDPYLTENVIVRPSYDTREQNANSERININIIFQVRALYKNKFKPKMFVEYTLIQFHLRMAKMRLCPFSTPINEDILRNIV